MYGCMVIGAPGSGKSTLCGGLSDAFGQLKRDLLMINLDPANDRFPYTCDHDIRELVDVESVMDRLNLGPNGALRYCMHVLAENAEWLLEKIRANKGKYVIIDCPGQLELYRSEGELHKLIRHLSEVGLCAVHMMDSLYCADPASFVSVVMSSLSAMVALELPHINVLSKCDLFDPDLPYDLDFYTRLPDLQRLLDVLSSHPLLAKYEKLNRCIIDVISDMDLVSFFPLSVSNKEDMARLICNIDKANGFAYIDKDLLIDTR